MKKQLPILLAYLLVMTLNSFGQRTSKNGTNYMPPLQIDSSGNFLISKLIEKTNRAKFGINSGYSSGLGICTDMIIYNSKTRKSKSLFKERFCLIYTIVTYFTSATIDYQHSLEYRNSSILKNQLLFLAKTNDINNDGILDEDDPTYLFLSNKEGDQLTQASPNDMDVISWTISKDQDLILVRLRKDKNQDKKFQDEDELFYQIDLNKDISKIKITPVEL